MLPEHALYILFVLISDSRPVGTERGNAQPFVVVFSIAAVSVPLCAHGCASRMKCTVTGYWEPLPGSEMFRVVLRHMLVYFKQFGTKTLSQVSVYCPFGQAGSMSSRCCPACRTLGTYCLLLDVFFFYKARSSVPSACGGLSCSSVISP